jgi:hypothetical protein
MPCGYPDNKELMGLLLQKFEILHKVELLIPPSLPSGHSHLLMVTKQKQKETLRHWLIIETNQLQQQGRLRWRTRQKQKETLADYGSKSAEN